MTETRSQNPVQGARESALDRFVACGLDVSGLRALCYEEEVQGELVQAWRDAPRRASRRRFSAPMPLPPLGVVVELDGVPAGALWLYEAVGAPVAWFDCAVTRPGLRLRDTKRVLSFALAMLMDLAGKCWDPPGEYRIFLGHVMEEMVETLKGMGLQFSPPGRFCGMCL